MTTIDFQNPPGYDELIETLLEKTQQGKLDWQETADEDRFLAAVKGRQTYDISARFGGDREREGRIVQDVQVRLTVRDSEGRNFLDIRESGQDSPAYQLFEAARRVAMRIDERIDQSVELLKSL